MVARFLWRWEIWLPRQEISFSQSFSLWVGMNISTICYVTRWVKTRHIPHFIKTKVRPEIGIPMFNCAAVKQWTRSVAWFLSYGAKCIADVEHVYVTTLSPYAIVLRKMDMCSCKRAARKSAKTVGKDCGGESGGLHCVYSHKDNHIHTGSLWNCLFWNPC